LNGRIPILLLTGYLGAGKTTLLNHLLSLPAIREKNLALVINEFGALGVDGELIRPGAYARFDLNKGSLFCICIKTDFIRTLEEISEKVRPELVLIEATGVAETRDIEAFLDAPHLGERFRIQANLCLVDAGHFIQVLPMLRAARSQVEWADGIILNKVDLAREGELEKLREILRAINPLAPMIEVERGQVPGEFVEGLGHRPIQGDLAVSPPDLVFSESFQFDGVVNRETFLAAVEALGSCILRLKGRVDFGDGLVFIEKAGGRLIERANPVTGKTGTAFVIIAWKALQKEVRQRIEETFQ